MAKGEAIYLARLETGYSEGVERFSLNSDIERQMLSMQRLLQSKVAVISVAGAFRKGKSFLLNFFLRYLRALSRGDTRDWIRSQDQLDDGFHWRAGTDRDTTGILIWSEPFFIRKRDGEEVAVLLMDTQGTFDHQSTQQDCTSIFAFSTLLSSVQIFNISQNIQETDLQHLRLFIEFAAMAKDSKEKVLQELWFLIRDWQNPDEFENGDEGGMRYLRKVLTEDDSMPCENCELRAGIKKYFQKMSCCLLPNPGKCATRTNFRGELDKLDDDFVEEVQNFVERVLSPEKLVKKAVNGRELTGGDIFKFAKVYYEAFRSGRLPSPKSLFSATVDLTNAAVATSSREMFAKKSRSIMSPTSAVEASQLERELQQLALESMAQFDKQCMQRGSPDCEECRRKLDDDLQREIQDLKLMNQLRSDKIAEQKKSELLAQDFNRLLREKEDASRKMEQMELDFQEKVKQISQASVSKEEMQSLLEKESMRRQLALQESEARNSQLETKIESLFKMNEELQRQVREGQQERKQQEAMTKQMMSQWEKHMADEQRRRQQEAERNAKLESFFIGVLQTASGELLRGAVSNFFSGNSGSGGTNPSVAAGATAPSMPSQILIPFGFPPDNFKPGVSQKSSPTQQQDDPKEKPKEPAEK